MYGEWPPDGLVAISHIDRESEWGLPTPTGWLCDCGSNIATSLSFARYRLHTCTESILTELLGPWAHCLMDVSLAGVYAAWMRLGESKAMFSTLL